MDQERQEKEQMKINNLWYNDIDHAFTLERQFSLKKYAEEIFKKMNRLGFSHFLDHMLTQNMRCRDITTERGHEMRSETDS